MLKLPKFQKEVMMKSVILGVLAALVLGGCASSVEYANSSPQLKNAPSSRADARAQIYVPAADMKSETFAVSNDAGLDMKIDVDVDRYAQETTAGFLANFYSGADKTSEPGGGLVFKPEVYNAKFELESADVIAVDGKPFVEYIFDLKVYRGGTKIYDQRLNSGTRTYGENVFFTKKELDLASFGKLLQESIFRDLERNAAAITAVAR